MGLAKAVINSFKPKGPVLRGDPGFVGLTHDELIGRKPENKEVEKATQKANGPLTKEAYDQAQAKERDRLKRFWESRNSNDPNFGNQGHPNAP